MGEELSVPAKVSALLTGPTTRNDPQQRITRRKKLLGLTLIGFLKSKSPQCGDSIRTET
jgi:hypothetical protein